MAQTTIPGGTAHRIPADFKAVLVRNQKALAAWQSITPLARNEWICRIVSVKKPETRQRWLTRTCEELAAGKRRPCCWAGCIHR